MFCEIKPKLLKQFSLPGIIILWQTEHFLPMGYYPDVIRGSAFLLHLKAIPVGLQAPCSITHVRQKGRGQMKGSSIWSSGLGLSMESQLHLVKPYKLKTQ
jgi:hypothetical protein